MKNVRAWHLIDDEAQRRDLPKLYRTDLLIDRETLHRENAPEKFAWVLRTNGTHLVYGTPDEICDHLATVSRGFTGNEKHWYWYDGRGLVEYPTALALIDRVQMEDGIG